MVINLTCVPGLSQKFFKKYLDAIRLKLFIHEIFPFFLSSLGTVKDPPYFLSIQGYQCIYGTQTSVSSARFSLLSAERFSCSFDVLLWISRGKLIAIFDQKNCEVFGCRRATWSSATRACWSLWMISAGKTRIWPRCGFLFTALCYPSCRPVFRIHVLPIAGCPKLKKTVSQKFQLFASAKGLFHEKFNLYLKLIMFKLITYT